MSQSEPQSIIDLAWDNRDALTPANSPDVREAVEQTIADLNAGRVRVAERESVGQWKVNQWVKKAVLLSFRLNDNQLMHAGELTFFDKVKTKFSHIDEAEVRASGVRIVPPAVARRGSYLGKNVVLMPSFVNIGAYVDEGTMVDAWATVGSCAQIGKNVHLSGGVGIGGVLEPLQANPTIIEDNCFIGARSEIVEGVIVEENSVISMGVYIGQSTKIYNRATGEVSYGRIPAGSVVVSGNLPSADGKYSLYCAVIVKQVTAETRARQHQRTAARLGSPASLPRSGRPERNHDERWKSRAGAAADGGEGGVGRAPVGGHADPDQDQRPDPAAERPAADAVAAAPAAGRIADAAPARRTRRYRRAQCRRRPDRRRQLPLQRLQAARHGRRGDPLHSAPSSRRWRAWACRRS